MLLLPEEQEKFIAHSHLSNRMLGQVFNKSAGWAWTARQRLGVAPRVTTARGPGPGRSPIPAPLMTAILETVANVCHMDLTEMLAERRHQDLVRARHMCMWIAHRHFGYSLPAIAKAMRKGDHTTVLHGVRKLEEEQNQRILAWAKTLAKQIRRDHGDENDTHPGDPGYPPFRARTGRVSNDRASG